MYIHRYLPHSFLGISVGCLPLLDLAKEEKLLSNGKPSATWSPLIAPPARTAWSQQARHRPNLLPRVPNLPPSLLTWARAHPTEREGNAGPIICPPGASGMAHLHIRVYSTTPPPPPHGCFWVFDKRSCLSCDCLSFLRHRFCF